MKPRASRDALGGDRDGALLVLLRASPVEGEANAALTRLLSRIARIPRSSVRILRGAAGREKLLRFEGLTARTLRERLAR